MARRKIIFATNEIYHVYNRGVEKRPIFLNQNDYYRLLDLIDYYRFTGCPLKYSHFKRLLNEEKASIMNELNIKSKKYVDILTFCFMPNHIHLLLRQLIENGISKFMAKVQNGFSHYFNISHERIGHLFQGNFGAVRIGNDDQLLHVNRYIHLNPISSYLVKLEDLERYKYSSYHEYIGKRIGPCNTKEILMFFKNIEDYQKFIFDQANYAMQLENIKHLLLE